MADHLFTPNDPPKPFRIEYSGPLYDGGNWDEFPVRYGWRSETGTELFCREAMPQKLHSGIECWLYFGMLHYVFGDQIDQLEFLYSEGTQQYLTTKHLNKYFDSSKEWKKRKLGERAVDIVKKVCEELAKYKSYVRSDMALAIRLVCHTLWNVTTKRDGHQTPTVYTRIAMYGGGLETEQLVKDGWCPLEVERCRMAGGGPDTPAFLLQLVRTKPGWNIKTHEICKKTECVANNIDESDYVTRHVREDCVCSHLQANIEQLHTILRDGGVPLVMLTPCEDKLGNQSFKIEIVRKRIGRQYAAISHVWSDGLGNTEGNTLPTCQIQLLYEQAKRLLTDSEYVPRYEGVYGPLHTGAARLAHFAGRQALHRDESVLLWIDTLCIPHQRDVRSLAIQRIREVYVDAYRTLILDSEIRQVDPHSTNHLELLLRVLYCSGWIRRLWTLQEGLAAKSRLYALFSDKAINISTIADELLTKLDRGKIPVLQERLASFAIGVWFSFFKHSIDYTSKFERLVTIVASPFFSEKSDLTQNQLIAWNWFNVAMRAASKPGDRPVILAGILNLDVKEILDVKGAEERMRKFYSLLDEFPQDVLFQDGPRFEEDGMRWAMKGCQYTGTIRYLSSGGGKITPRGLHITLFRSWLFSFRMAFDLRLFDLEEGQRAWEQWINEHQLEDVTSAPNVRLLKTEIPVDLDPNGSYGVIVRESENSGSSPSMVCALVTLQTTEDAVCYAQYNTLGSIETISSFANLPDKGFLVRVTWDDLQKREWIVG